jgi:putative transposase
VLFQGRWLSLWDSYGLDAYALRAGKMRRARARHAKVANRRKDFLHQHSAALVRQHRATFVGNVNSQALARGRHAKSVLDTGWSAFRTILQYKCADAGAWFAQIGEAHSTQTCSACGARGGPKGTQGLGMREWTCPRCGVAHQRDANAAKNILAAGHRRLAEGILLLTAWAARARRPRGRRMSSLTRRLSW